MEKSLTQQAEFEHQRRQRIYKLKRLAGASLKDHGQWSNNYLKFELEVKV